MVTASPLFSILLPTHNRDDVLPFAIQSVLKQTYDNFELLIVGDGCTDSTDEVVQKFAAKDKRIQWFDFPKSPGFGYDNRNAVLKKAKGKYVAYMGHDDLWLPTHLETHRHFFEQNPDYLIAYTRPLWLTESGILLLSFFNTDNRLTRNVFNKEHNEIPGICFVYKRSATKQSGQWIPNTINAGDWDFWRRIIVVDPDRKLGFIPTPTTINFKSSWRKEGQYLNEHLQVMESIVTSSPSLKENLTIHNALQRGEVQQSFVWERINSLKKAEELINSLTTSIDEIVYALTLESYVLKRDKARLVQLVQKLKSTKIYRLFHELRKSIV